MLIVSLCLTNVLLEGRRFFMDRSKGHTIFCGKKT